MKWHSLIVILEINQLIRMIGIIAAVSKNWVIGVDNKIPWNCPEDLKRFKRITKNSTIIMGRNTWESLPYKPLRGRENIVITSRNIKNTITFKSIPEALASVTGDVWFIGGREIFIEGLKYSNMIDITIIDIIINDENAIYFPKEKLKEKLMSFKEDCKYIHECEDDDCSYFCSFTNTGFCKTFINGCPENCPQYNKMNFRTDCIYCTFDPRSSKLAICNEAHGERETIRSCPEECGSYIAQMPDEVSNAINIQTLVDNVSEMLIVIIEQIKEIKKASFNMNSRIDKLEKRFKLMDKEDCENCRHDGQKSCWPQPVCFEPKE